MVTAMPESLPHHAVLNQRMKGVKWAKEPRPNAFPLPATTSTAKFVGDAAGHPGEGRDNGVLMTGKDLEILEKTEAFRGYFRVNAYRLRHRLHGGGWSREFTREVFERGHAAAMLPYDPVRDSVVLIEQFRIGAHAAGRRPWLIEVVAGIIEKGEDPEEVVRRETMEEAGCAVTDLVPISSYLVSAGGTSETVSLYCGRVDASNAGGIHGCKDEDEDIRVLVLPFEKAFTMVESGEIANSAALVSLLWLALNRERLRKEWR